ncbi:MAG TPA: hypothetical protein PKA36_17600 [Pseudoxanthomonas mexicana]|nr:hypothetical protein [Pseudoxanthomonas mexicana]
MNAQAKAFRANVCVYCGQPTLTTEPVCCDCAPDGELVPAIGAAYRDKLEEQFNRVFRTVEVE